MKLNCPQYLSGLSGGFFIDDLYGRLHAPEIGYLFNPERIEMGIGISRDELSRSLRKNVLKLL